MRTGHFKCFIKWLFQGYHWEKEKNPITGEFLIHHKYGICILKEFPEPPKETKQLISEYAEHKSSVLNYENNETETHLNLSIAHKERFEKTLSGLVSQNLFWEHNRELRIHFIYLGRSWLMIHELSRFKIFNPPK